MTIYPVGSGMKCEESKDPVEIASDKANIINTENIQPKMMHYDVLALLLNTKQLNRNGQPHNGYQSVLHLFSYNFISPNIQNSKIFFPTETKLLVAATSKIQFFLASLLDGEYI